MSGVVPFFSLLGGAGFLPGSFLGVFGFFFFVGFATSLSPLGLARLERGGFEPEVLVSFACLLEIPMHLLRCRATLVITKYRGQLGHFTVGNETFSDVICLKEAAAGVDRVDCELEAVVVDWV